MHRYCRFKTISVLISSVSIIQTICINADSSKAHLGVTGHLKAFVCGDDNCVWFFYLSKTAMTSETLRRVSHAVYEFFLLPMSWHILQ